MATIKIQKHTVSPSDEYFFDTNVWIYIYGSIAASNANIQQVYGSLLRAILSRNSTIWINSLVISEYINRMLRLEFENWKRNNGGFYQRISLDVNDAFKKYFRPTNDYTLALTNIDNQVNDILKIATRRPDDFNAVNIQKIIQGMSSNVDFNDSYIIDCCRRYNYILVSHDRDMQNFSNSIRILTA